MGARNSDSSEQRQPGPMNQDANDSQLPQVDVNYVPRSAEVATLMRARLGAHTDGLDIALAGVPFDGGSSFRVGARHGPAQMREMSRLIRKAHYATGAAPFEICRIADIGDAPVNPLDMAATLQSVRLSLATCARPAPFRWWLAATTRSPYRSYGRWPRRRRSGCCRSMPIPTRRTS